MSFYLNFCMKNLLLTSPYLVKKMSILSKLHHTFDLKILKIPFFSDFLRKSTRSFTHILSKNFILSNKNTLLSYDFFRIFHKKPPAVMPLFGQKKRKFVKTTLYYSRKKSIGCPLFPIYHEKITALMPMLFNKDVHSLKIILLSIPCVFEKTSIL